MPEQGPGRRVAVLGTVDRGEVERLRERLAPRGCTVTPVEGGAASGGEYDAVVVFGEGGDPAVIRDFLERDKVVALVGDAVRTLEGLGLARGRTLVGGSRAEALREGGADVVDRPVAVDQRLVTAQADAIDELCDALGGAVVASAEERRQDALVEQTFPASDPLPGPTAIGGEGASGGRPEA